MSTTEFVGYWITNYWRGDPSIRSILYYAALLMKKYPKEKEIGNKLLEMSSLQSMDFARIVSILTQRNILIEGCLLNMPHGAFDAVMELIKEDMGAYNPPLNGLEIYEANTKKRYELWVEEGSKWLIKAFKNKVENLTIKVEKLPRNRGLLVIFETTLIQPFIIFFFVNTKRILSSSELAYLTTRTQVIENNRKAEIRRIGISEPEDILMGSTGIRVAAAPTYSQAVAWECFSGDLPTPLTGPINMASLLWHLDQHPKCRREQYEVLLDFLNPFGGGIAGGIVLSDWVIQQFRTLIPDYDKNCKN